MTKFQIVTDRATKADIFCSSDPVADFQERGWRHIGTREGKHLRPELQGGLAFDGLAGPMWGGYDHDGNVILRYEDWASYDVLSR